jgi:DNA-binding response OmpR family regulator
MSQAESTTSIRAPLLLIVEDDLILADAIHARFALAGYRTEQAADGLAGLARVQADSIDLVLLDLQPPGLGG